MFNFKKKKKKRTEVFAPITFQHKRERGELDQKFFEMELQISAKYIIKFLSSFVSFPEKKELIQTAKC